MIILSTTECNSTVITELSSVNLPEVRELALKLVKLHQNYKQNLSRIPLVHLKQPIRATVNKIKEKGLQPEATLRFHQNEAGLSSHQVTLLVSFIDSL